MPSPQSLVAFSLGLFLLLVVLRVQVGLGPNIAAGCAIAGALLLGALVERLIPPEEDEQSENDAETVDAEDAR